MAYELEEDATILFRVDPEFPVADVEAIAHRVADSNCLVPGFIAPAAGITNLPGLLYASLIDGTNTIVIPDRNIASRMSRIAREGASRPFDTTTEIAVDLMALSQAMNLDIDPGLAFHELAHSNGNAVANAELRWFRAADFGQAHAWIDIALGRKELLPSANLGEPTTLDFAAPLHRWRCNYAATLKMASLELAGGPAVARLERLMQWMVDDFIVAGPAAMFAGMYFGPRAARGGLIKHVKAADRERAIAGARNAAWDITYISELSRKANSEDYMERRFMFATGDRKLAQLAACVFVDAADLEIFQSILGKHLEQWWGSDASRAARAIIEAIATATSRPPPFQDRRDVRYVDEPITELEAFIRSWK